MSPKVSLLILGSAVLHALWNAILKRQPDPERAVVAILAVTALSSTCAALVAGGHPLVPSTLVWSLAAGVCEACYFVTLARALSRAPLGPVYTVTRGGALLATWPASMILFDEAFSVSALIGAALVGGGLAAVGLGGPTLSRHDRTSGLAWASVCAVFIAGYHLCYKQALATGGTPTTIVAISLGAAVSLNVARLGSLGVRRVVETVASNPTQIVLAGVLATASFTIFLDALSRIGAGAALTLRNTSVLFAQAFGLALGERPKPLQWCGAILVAVGAVAIAWPAS